MSMLAEPRRKQKIATNPNGLSFIADEDNVGQQLLAKMGWEKGKGLGKDKQGMIDPIKQKKNSDSRGLGFDIKTDNNWIAHQDDFNSLLADLNEGVPAAPDSTSSQKKVSSLENNSKGSRSRLHYQKFTKGKDLSQHSEKDLAMIFGQPGSRSATPTIVRSEPTSKVVSDTEETAGDRESDPFLSDTKTVTSTLSLQEYFAARMASRSNSRANSGADLTALTCKTPSPVADNVDKEPETIGQASFFIGESLSPEEMADTENQENVRSEKRKKKKKNRQEEEVVITKKCKKRKREVHLESARHKHGGKTKPKPIDDTMTFISDDEPESDSERLEQKSNTTLKSPDHTEEETQKSTSPSNQSSDNDQVEVVKKKSKKHKKKKNRTNNDD